MALLKIGRREYESRDKRFHVVWTRNQGSRDCYRVLDRSSGRCLRAFNLPEVRETVSEMRRANAKKGG